MVKLDTKNGRAEYLDQLNLENNTSYVLVLKSSAKITEIDKTPNQPWTEEARLVDPTSTDKILRTVMLLASDKN